MRGSVVLTEDNGAVRATRPLPVLPISALDQLARVHVETSQASRLFLFLRSSVHVAAVFLLMGSCVLLLGGGATIGRNFSWAALVLIGVTALIHSYIRTNAAAFDRAPASQSARKLRMILFYMGFAWGAGAFLAMPPDLPVLAALLFALLPTLLLAFLLNDTGGLAAFLAPCGVLTIAASFLLSWPHATLDAIVILILQWGLFAGMVMRRRTPLPAGLALR